MPAMIETNLMPFQHWSETDVAGVPIAEKTNPITRTGECRQPWRPTIGPPAHLARRHLLSDMVYEPSFYPNPAKACRVARIWHVHGDRTASSQQFDCTRHTNP